MTPMEFMQRLVAQLPPLSGRNGMTDELSKRLAALERASSKAPALRIVVANFGETAQEALKRVGVVPGSGQRVLVVVFG